MLIGLIVLLATVACGKSDEPDKQLTDLVNNDQRATAVSLNQMLGGWSLVSIDGVPTVREEELDDGRYVGFEVGLPCYELGDYHCNPEDDGWDPLIPQAGRFSIRGFSGCNGFGAESRLIDGVSESKPILSTQIGCPKVSTQENRLFTILSSKAQVTLKADRLFIQSFDGGKLELLRNDSK